MSHSDTEDFKIVYQYWRLIFIISAIVEKIHSVINELFNTDSTTNN